MERRKPMKTYNVLIADNEKSKSAEILIRLLQRHKQFNVFPLETDGKSALDALLANKIDILIFEIILPKMDGIEVLRQYNARLEGKPRPLIIGYSSISEDNWIKSLQDEGMMYLFSKTVDARIIARRLCDYLKIPDADMPPANREHNAKGDDINKALNGEYLESYESTQFEAYKLATELMHALSIPANIAGYRYIREAALTVVRFFPDGAFNITNQIYQIVAMRLGTSPTRVERSIRHAIETACNHGNVKQLHDIFGYTINAAKGKPTNKEFISLLADKIIIGTKQSYI